MRLLPVPAIAALLAVLAALAPAPSRAEVLRITVTNPQDAGGLAITPLWFGLHDGTFDAFDPGAAAYDDGNPATTDFPFIRPSPSSATRPTWATPSWPPSRAASPA